MLAYPLFNTGVVQYRHVKFETMSYIDKQEPGISVKIRMYVDVNRDSCRENVWACTARERLIKVQRNV